MNALSDFHWLRPEGLWALLPLAVIIWRLLHQARKSSAWEKQCDPHLLEKLLIRRARYQRWPLVLLAVAWILAVIALAGPVWQKLPEPVYRTQAARVIVLDLSPSMNAPDLRPSRIARARFKVLDLLTRYREGQTALVVFAGEPFVVSPLTDDTKTIAALVPTLSPNLMPDSGDHAHTALRMADELLRQAGIQNQGEIVLVTDGYDDPAATLEAVTTLRAHGRRVSVLADGTEEGAPITLSNGGFLKDSTGAIVVPRLDSAALSELARQGGGHFARLSADDRDIDSLSADTMARPREVRAESSHQRSMDRWREEGPWLVLILLPLAALAFRRGWLAVVVLGVLILPDPAAAFSWQDLWARPDQRGAQALQAGEEKKAAELFQDPAWKGAARYQAGDYEKALENFSQSDGTDALYNRGNALTHLGQLQEAIAAYAQALKKDPTNADARNNKAVVEKLLKQQQQQQQQSKNDSQKNQQGQNGEQDRQSSKNSSADSPQSASADKKNNPESQNNKQQMGQQKQPESGKSANGSSSENQANAHQSQPESEHSNQNQSRPQEKPSNSTPSTARSKPSKADDNPSERSAARSKPAETDANPQKDSAATTQTEAETSEDADRQAAAARATESPEQSEDQQAMDQWLRRIPDDPAGLLRRKFLLEHLRRQQQAAQRGE